MFDRLQNVAVLLPTNLFAADTFVLTSVLKTASTDKITLTPLGTKVLFFDNLMTGGA